MSKISKDIFANKEFKEKFKKRMNDEEVKNKILESNPQKKQVFQYNANGDLIAIYPSVNKAAISIGLSPAAISGYCLGRIKPRNKYVYSYEKLDKSNIIG